MAGLRKIRSPSISVERFRKVYLGPFLHSPKGALESCDCSDQAWAVYGGLSSFSFRNCYAVTVEAGEDGTSGEGGMRMMARLGKAVVNVE